MKRSITDRVVRRVRHKIVYGLRSTTLYPWIYPARWRAARMRDTRTQSVRHYMTAEPNPGAGIGHQLANWIAGYYFAKVFGCTFAHTPFPDAAWETMLGFGADEASAADLCKQGVARVRLPLFDESAPAEIAGITHIIASYRKRPVLFVLEYDQFFRAQYPVAPALAEKFARANPAAFARPLAERPLRIAVHVRRGDVSEHSHNPNISMRWMDAGYFKGVLHQVIMALDGIPAEIELFSQGKSDDFTELEKVAAIRFRTDDAPEISFRDMAIADILITSKSSFSYKPALLGRGLRIVPGNFWHEYPDDPLWVTADDAGYLDTDRLRHGIAALHAAAEL